MALAIIIYFVNREKNGAVAMNLRTGFPLKARDNDDGEGSGYFHAME